MNGTPTPTLIGPGGMTLIQQPQPGFCTICGALFMLNVPLPEPGVRAEIEGCRVCRPEQYDYEQEARIRKSETCEHLSFKDCLYYPKTVQSYWTCECDDCGSVYDRHGGSWGYPRRPDMVSSQAGSTLVPKKFTSTIEHILFPSDRRTGPPIEC